MKNPLTNPFEFEGIPVRVAVDEGGESWYCAKDVCAILDIKNHRDAVAALDEDERDGVDISDAMGRLQKTAFVSESGLYTLIFKSSKPSARQFRKWVAGEVLPAIRKEGHFGSASALESALSPSDRIRLTGYAVRLLGMMSKRDPAIRENAALLLKGVQGALGIPALDDLRVLTDC